MLAIPSDDLADRRLGRATLFEALVEEASPVEDLTVSQWADRYRVVSAESGSPFPGPWRTDRMPHLREPMDCLHPDHPAASVTLKCSAQIGKSEIIVNWFGFTVDRVKPAPMMIMLPSLDEAIKFNRVKLQPTIDASPQIRGRVAAENQRDEAASTASFKRFPAGFAQIVTASSSKGLQMVSIRNIARDEVSEYPLDTDGRGDPVEQSRARLKTYSGLGLAKELNCSTPGLAGMCRISAYFEAGDRRRWYVPCPHCDAFQVLVPERMQAPAEATGWRATFSCQGCGALIDQVERAGMIARAHWIPTRVEPGAPAVPEVIPAAEIERWRCDPCTGRCRGWQPSYAIWAALSPMENWTDIWRRDEASKANPVLRKSHVQQDRGEPYEAKSDAPDAEKLHAAREEYPARVVPHPAAVLTGFVDVQRNPPRLEWGVWAWGPRAEGWIIDRGIIPHPIERDEAWDEVDELLRRSYPTQGGGEILVDRWGIDTGDQATDLYLRVKGRSHRLIACKGANRPDALPVRRTEGKIHDKAGRVIEKVPLTLIGNFGIKSHVYQGLANLVAGRDAKGLFPPGTLHLCADLIDEDQCRQLTAEVLVDPRQEAKGNARRHLHQRSGDRREWMKKVGQANEALDIVVGARALAIGIGVDGFSAERWARLWRQRGAVAPAPDLFTAADPAAQADEAARTEAPVDLPDVGNAPRKLPAVFGLAKPVAAPGSTDEKKPRGLAALAALNKG